MQRRTFLADLGMGFTGLALGSMLADDGVVFPVSYSQAGWTLPSVASIFTGRHPKDHGATDFQLPIAEGMPTMAEILAANGYETKGFVSHIILDQATGIARGFQEYDSWVLEIGNPHKVSSSSELTTRALAAMGRATEPWFIWIHYFDPHFDYLAHTGFGVFGDSGSDRYDQEIAHTDLHIGRLLDEVPDDTIVIFTSDHGEEFGEHDGLYHYTLHSEVMRTPLVIRAPFLEPGIDSSVAEQIDILPTLLSMLGIESDAPMVGRDLFDPSIPDGPTFVERDRPPGWRQRGVIVGKRSLFVIEEVDPEASKTTRPRTAVPVTNVRPGIYLYDEEILPGEKLNLYFEEDPEGMELLGLLMSHFGKGEDPAERAELDEDLKEKLRKLGYIE